MSSTKRPVRTGERDAYYTPDAVAAACVGVLHLAPDATVLEPSVGGGAFVRAMPGRRVTALDIDPAAPGLRERLESSEVVDFERWRPGAYRPEWVVGNPPFNSAQAHVELAIRYAQVGVGMLLRLAFLEGLARRSFWSRHPASEIHVLARRPSFTGGGTDSAAYGFYVWRKGATGPTMLRHLDWGSRG